MALKVVRGLENAEEVLVRVDPLDLTSLPESVLARTRQAFGDDVTPAESVVKMLADVRRDGDSAVRHYAKLLDGADLEHFRIDEAEVNAAREVGEPGVAGVVGIGRRPHQGVPRVHHARRLDGPPAGAG